METIARRICYALGYRLAVDSDDGELILFAPGGHWDHWRDTSRWWRLLRWHFIG